MFITESTHYLNIISFPPFFMDLPNVALYFLLRLECFATDLTETRFLTMSFHMSVKMMRIRITLATLITDVNFVSRSVCSLLMIIQSLFTFEFEFANITLEILFFRGMG